MKRKSRKPLTFVRNAFWGKRANPVREPLKKDTGGINPCFRPSAGASKADLREFHKEDLKLRRAAQLKRTPNVRQPASRSIATHSHEHKREIARA
jgi:hypothetical protein